VTKVHSTHQLLVRQSCFKQSANVQKCKGLMSSISVHDFFSAFFCCCSCYCCRQQRREFNKLWAESCNFFRDSYKFWTKN